MRPRLLLAAEMLRSYHTVADIGCDHGRLSVALLQSFEVARTVAVDVSAPSLEKAAWLANRTNLFERIDLRVGDGLSPLLENEADAIAICGMGGMLIKEILESAQPPLRGARRVVLQPMRGVSDIRKYLYTHGYRIIEDHVVRDAGRLYQIFAAELGKEDPLPAFWPQNCFSVGHKAMQDPAFSELIQNLLVQYQAKLAGAKGTRGEKILREKVAQMQQIWEELICS